MLEIKDRDYTSKFGGGKVTKSDVLDLSPTNSDATIRADIATGDGVPDDAFDCIIFTQTLQLIYDFRGAVRTLYRLLAPRGVLLATFPGISRNRLGEKEAEARGGEWSAPSGPRVSP